MTRTLGLLAHALLLVGLVGEALTLVLVSPHEPALLTWRSPDVLLPVLTDLAGWVLAWRRPRTAIGWLLLGSGVINAPGGVADALSLRLARTDPVAGALLSSVGFGSEWTWIPTLSGLVIVVPLLFPNGRVPSPRWRWFAGFAAFAIVASTVLGVTAPPRLGRLANPVHIPWPGGVAAALLVVAVLLPISAIGAFVSLVVRYRAGGAIERAQLRWLFWAVGLIIGWLVLANIENAIFGDESSRGVPQLVAFVLDFIAGLAYCLIPVSIMVGVLRHGLYAIDRIISRTAAYSIVTLAVIGTYLAAVLLLSLVLPRQQTLGIAVSTLAAAAVFLPVLHRVRRLIDRRFDRARYDAERVVAAFGQRIRNGADPHTAGTDLVEAVERTLQPAAVGLWTRERRS